MRIVSICPSNTEILAWLDRLDLLVAVDDYSDWPKQIQQLPRLGPDLSIDMDLLEQQEPDLVLSSLSVPGMEENVEELERRGIRQLVLNPQTLDDIARDIERVGHALGEKELGEKKAAQFQTEIEAFKMNIRHPSNSPSIYFEWWPKPIFTPGRRNWLTEMAELAGGKNCFQDVDLASVQTDWDDIITRNPDYICLAWVGVKQEKMKISHVLKRPNADQLKAVQNNNIYLLEEALFCRPSPRLLKGLQKLDQIIE